MPRHLPHLIILMRHGIAANFASSDKDRPLTEDGVKQTQMIAKNLLRRCVITHLISSDYLRARQTADIVEDIGDQLGHLAPERLKTPALGVSTNWSLWSEYFLELTKKLKHSDTLMLVGHEPSISEIFAGHLGLDTPISSFRKAGIAIISPVNEYKCELVAYLPPAFME